MEYLMGNTPALTIALGYHPQIELNFGFRDSLFEQIVSPAASFDQRMHKMPRQNVLRIKDIQYSGLALRLGILARSGILLIQHPITNVLELVINWIV